MSEQERQSSQDQNTCCFTGSYVRSVDGKGRFNLPFRFRNSGADGDGVVASEGPGRVLVLMTSQEWSRAFEKVRATGLREHRNALRHQSRNSHMSRLDSQGRVTLPVDLLKRHGVADKLVVVGMGHYMEIWAPERLEASEAGEAPPSGDFLDDFYG